MEENKQNKTKLSTFIIILAILVIIIMAGFIYMQKVSSDREIAGLKNDAEELKATVTELQGKLDSISNIASTSKKENNAEKESTESITQEISGPGYIAKLENDTVKITLKNENGVWTDSDFNKPINNKTYSVLGLDKGIKKIVAANMARDVSPEILILMDDGKVKYVELSGPIIGAKNPENIQFTAANIPWLTDLENIVDIKVDGDYHYAIDNTGKEIEIWNND
ncbi:MAG: hypothetical protein IKF17_02505 [Clostridia bacterium]|nr:hypothetical protein [Clostridia bacterium]